ncbi:MAG: hypothetical protein RL499_1544, partial [Actinomycetota bacterium]
ELRIRRHQIRRCTNGCSKVGRCRIGWRRIGCRTIRRRKVGRRGERRHGPGRGDRRRRHGHSTRGRRRLTADGGAAARAESRARSNRRGTLCAGLHRGSPLLPPTMVERDSTFDRLASAAPVVLPPLTGDANARTLELDQLAAQERRRLRPATGRRVSSTTAPRDPMPR